VQINKKNIDIFKGDEFKRFVIENVQKDSFALSLSAKMSSNTLQQQFMQQLHLYQKAADKLPAFVEKFCLFTLKSYEQCSSQATAMYKTSLFSKGKVLDLTGGLGVDDWAFAKAGNEVVSLEPNEELNEIATYNFTLLRVNHIKRISVKAEDYLEKHNEVFGCVYCDADRRPGGKKVYDLSGSVPDILSLMLEIFSCTSTLLIKASPMVDITSCIRQLQCVERAIVVQWREEVREVLFLVKKDFAGEASISAVEVDDKGNVLQEISSAKANAPILIEKAVSRFLYEPVPAVVKAALVNEVAATFGLSRVGINSAYLIGNKEGIAFWGRTFRIQTIMPYKPEVLKKYLKEKNIEKANVAKRDFPLQVEDIRKKFKLKDGGNDYLFFSKGATAELLFFHCLK